MKNYVQVIQMCFFFSFIIFTLNSWDYSKFESHPDGAESLSELKREGDFYVVDGADLHNLGRNLIGKEIIFTGYIREIKKFPAKTLLLLSEDKCYYVIVYCSAPLGNVPSDLSNAIINNGLRSATFFLGNEKYGGDKVTIFGRIERLQAESGINKSVLQYLSCIIDSVSNWDVR